MRRCSRPGRRRTFFSPPPPPPSAALLPVTRLFISCTPLPRPPWCAELSDDDLCCVMDFHAPAEADGACDEREETPALWRGSVEPDWRRLSRVVVVVVVVGVEEVAAAATGEWMAK